MASTYSTSLRLELIGTGDQSGTWGDTTNTNLGTLLEQAIGGYQSIVMSDANYTLTTANGAADEARNMVVRMTGILTANRNVNCPNGIEKLYLVINDTTGGFSLTFKTASGTGITIPNGKKALIYVDGTNALSMLNSAVIDTPVLTGGTISGAAISGGTVSGATLTGSTYSGTIGTLSGGTISSSTYSGTIGTLSGGTISSSTYSGTIGTLSGGTISSSTFSGGTVSGATITGGTVGSLSSPLAIASGGTAATSATTARSNLAVAGLADANTFTANQVISVTDNTNAALRITQLGTGNAFVVEDSTNPDSTPFAIGNDGNVGIGSGPGGTTSLLVTKNHTGGTAFYGVTSAGTIQSDVTVASTAFFTNMSTAAAAFSTSINHYQAFFNSLGVGSTITAQRCFLASAMTQATTNIGFQAADASGIAATKTAYAFYTVGNAAPGGGGTAWAFYSGGTAPNLFAGNTGVGAATNVSKFRVYNDRASNTYNTVFSTANGATFENDTIIGFNGTYGYLGNYQSYPFSILTNNTEQFRIGTAGQLGIGGATYGTSGQALLSGGASAAPSWTTIPLLNTTNTFANNQIIQVTDNTNAALRVTQLGTGDALRVEDSANPDATPFIIDASGNVRQGTAAPSGLSSPVYSIGTDTSSGGPNFSITNTVNDTQAGVILFHKARGALAPASDDEIGTTSYRLYDGTAYDDAAYIIGSVDGTPSGTSAPGRLSFHTTASGATTPTERLRINNAGALGVGGANFGTSGQALLSGGSSAAPTWTTIPLLNTTNAFTASQSYSASLAVDTADNTNAALRVTQRGTGDALLVEDSTNPDATPFLINNVGAVVNGYTSSLNTFSGTSIAPSYQSIGTLHQNVAIGIAAFSAAPRFIFARSAGASVGTYTATAADVTLGTVLFQGSDGTDFNTAATIAGEADGIFSGTSTPGRIVFNTTASGATSVSERMRIRSDGNISIGGSGDASTTLSLEGPTATNGTSSGIKNSATVQAGVTSYRANITTIGVSATGAVTNLSHFNAQQGTITAGGTITNQYGYLADNTLTGATTNYGFTSQLASATGRWNFYASGTAPNYFAGDVRTNTVLMQNISVTTANASATLTASGMIGGLYTSTPTAATTFTLPLGTSMEAAFQDLQVGQSFKWSIINLATSFTITVAANTGHTVVGYAVVPASSNTAAATFLTRKSAANTFVTYRISY